MRQVYEQVAQVARTNTTVLLRGESGTGKELIAHAIHYNSPRAKKPFIKVSCAALPQDLIESELFGYEKGAFTGAQAPKKGRFELADGGTLFLDEIGELNLATQVKLLRVLQEREFERLGGTETIRVEPAAGRRHQQGSGEGDRRRRVPRGPLLPAQRLRDLRRRRCASARPTSCCSRIIFSRSSRASTARTSGGISTPAIDMLMAYHWPGNVRELANVIERAVVVCDANVVHAHHLPPTLQTAEASDTGLKLTLRDMLEAVEKDALQDALKSARGNRAKAARLLATTERIFNYKVRKYGLDWRRFRS